MPASNVESVNCRHLLANRKHVPDDQISLFCDILRFKGDLGEGFEDEYTRRCYVNRLRPLLPKLRFPLAKPPSIVRKLLLPEQSQYTRLCDMHAGLNADFVHQWFKFVALEVGARLEILRSGGPEQVGEFAWENVIAPLTRLHKIWLSAEQVHEAFGDFSEVENDPQMSLIDVNHQHDGCEACILARIGTHINTVWALRTLIKSRISLESHSKHPSRLRLLRLVEPWIQCYQARYDNAPEEEPLRIKQRELSTGLAEELYEMRKEIEINQHRQRRAQRKLLDLHYSGSTKYKKLVKDLEADAVNDSIYDAENDIIDTYAALRATQRASALLSASIAPNAEGQPLPEKDQSRKAKSLGVTRGESSPYLSKADLAYNESRYSVDTVRNNDRAILKGSSVFGDPKSNVRRAPRKTVYSVVSSDEFLRDSPSGTDSRERAVSQHASSATVWPVFSNGSRIELRSAMGDLSRSTPARENTPTTSVRGERQSKGHSKADTDSSQLASCRSSSHTDNSGRQSKARKPTPSEQWLTLGELQQQSDLEPDCYHHQQEVRRSNIPFVEEDIEDPRSRPERSATVSTTSSGYSGYYQQNGPRAYARRSNGSRHSRPQDDSRITPRLSQPFETPAAEWQDERSPEDSLNLDKLR